MPARPSHLLVSLRRPWAVWLALCLALIGALTPTLSHALVWARGDVGTLVQVCSSAGPRWMALPGPTDTAAVTRLTDPLASSAQVSGKAKAAESAPGAPGSTVVLDHCPFCLLLADRLAPSAQAQPLFFVTPGHAVVAASPPAAHVPAQVIAAAHPRGPPAL